MCKIFYSIRKSIFTIFSFFIFHFSFSQQPSHFFLGEEVFSGVQIYDVIQDNENNYWFATDQGFFKYDNYSFKRVSCKNMKGTSAFGFVKDSKGIIYCFNLNKQIIKIENSFCSVFYELKNEEFTNDIQLIINGKDELMIYAGKVICFNQRGEKLYALNYYGTPFKLSNGTIISNLIDKDSLLVYNGKQFKTEAIDTKGKPIKGILNFFESNKHVYAVSNADKQFYIYESKKPELIPFIKFDELDPKEHSRFYAVDGSLWIAGALSGVYRCEQDRNNFTIKGKYFKDYLISDVFKDNEGNLLFSTFNHGVMVVPFLGIPDVLPFKEIESPVSIAIDESYGILIGTIKGELWNISPNGRKVINENGSRPVQAVFTFPDFPYYIFDDGKIKVRHKLTGKTYELAKSSLKDAVFYQGVVYLSLNSSVGKIYLENEIPKFETYDDINFRSYAIDVDETGIVYIATSEGLITLDGHGETNPVIYNGESVFANDIYSTKEFIYAATNKDAILKIKRGKVVAQIQPKWANTTTEIIKITAYANSFCLLTSTGFYYVNYDGQIIFQLNKMLGFSTRRIYGFEIVGEGDAFDKLWLVHSKGVHQFNINILEGIKVDRPSIQLRSFFVNNELVSISTEQIFKYDSRDFRFEFTSPSLKNKENIHYHYMLEGYDTKWHIKDYYSNVISYNALAPGKYTFLVKAENQGIYSDVISYSFTVKGPFYYTWWFILLIMGGIIILIILFYRRKLMNQRRKARILNELNQSKLTAIQSQMNPHFIFNALNSIQDLVLKGDIENSYSYITDFSNLVRKTLTYSEKDFIDFEQELKLIQLYLSLEKLRFKKDFNYEIITINTEDILIPPLLIQPFVENSLVHGLFHKDGSKELKIIFELNEKLTCTIIDNGVGREASKTIKAQQNRVHPSFSGEAIKKRFEILSEVNDSKFGYSYVDLYENNQATGTKVIIDLPFKNKF